MEQRTVNDGIQKTYGRKHGIKEHVLVVNQKITPYV